MTGPDTDERRRLDALHSFQILDSSADPIFDRLTRFAARFCRTPIATLTLVDEHRQWFMSRIGLDLKETDRAISFCAHTIGIKAPFILEDARGHPAFSDNPLVTGPPGLRFYAGVPLVTVNGYALGTLAVMDTRPRRLKGKQMEVLEMLAEQAMTHIALRHQRHELDLALAEQSRMNHVLQNQARHLSDAQRIANLGSWEMELPSRRLRCSEQIYRIFGLVRRDEPEDFSAFLGSVHASDRHRLEIALEAALRGETKLNIVHRIVLPGGGIRHVHQRGELRDGGDQPPILAGTVQDVTDQRKAMEELELLHACISRVSDVVMITEAEPLSEPGPRIVFVNSAFEQQTGYAAAEVLGRSPRLLQGPQTQRVECDRIRNALQRREKASASLVNYRKDGSAFWQELEIAPVSISSDKVTHFVSIQRDITERKAAEQKIERLAFFDPLTRLPNRKLLMDRLEHAMEAAKRQQHTGALLFIDLDNFKSLNDTLGHDMGDVLLEQVARRLERSVRKSNTVARLGGDEFVVMLEDLGPERRAAAAQAETVAEKVLDCFRQPFFIAGLDHHCTPSIGVAFFSETENNVEELLKRADLAMYQAKASGRNTIRFFDPEMQAVVNAKVALDRDFRQGLARHEFVLYYQRQIDASNRVVGAEALVRWRHPHRGLLYPVDFIAMAEDSGLILPLGQWVMEAACMQLADWSGEAAASPVVAINVSARQFRHPDFVAQTLAVLSKTGIDPARVKLELTESALVERIGDVVEKMIALRQHGIRFSLDDFGTGYSSLSYLKQLPLDQLKIDRSFVQNIATNLRDGAIAGTILALGRNLGLEVVAEGIETEAQRDVLARYGCQIYQGNLISPPVPAGLF